MAVAMLLAASAACLAQGARWVGPLEPKSPPPNAPGFYKVWCEQREGANTVRRPVMIFLPDGYGANPTAKWPMLVFLHGAGEGGDSFGNLDVHGPIRHAQDDAKFRAALGMIVVSPQAPGGRSWLDPAMSALVGEVIDGCLKSLRADPDRVYLTGLSMGGTGTWHVAANMPERFAAIMPICARATDTDRVVQALKKVPVWIIVGDSDGDFTRDSKNMFQLLRSGGNTGQITVFPNEGHGVWGRVYPEIRYYQWLARQKRVSGAVQRYTDAQLQDAEKKVADAEAALSAQKYAEGIKMLSMVIASYPGSTFAAGAREKLDKLRVDPNVRAQIEAAEMSAKAEALYHQARNADQAKDVENAQRLYEAYVRNYPKGEKFAEAKARLDALAGDPKLQAEINQRRADAECKEWLSMADNYIAANKPDIAKTYLTKILDKYATTTWGAKAKERLEKIKGG